MTDSVRPADKFFKNTDLSLEETTQIVKQGLEGADYGEFYQEIVEKETLVKDKGAYTTISVGNLQSGFGFRVGQQERVGYSFSDVFNKVALKDAVQEAREVLKSDAPVKPAPSGKTMQQFYSQEDPMAGMTLEEKIARIDAIEAYVKTLDPRITNIKVTYTSQSQSVHVITADGQSLTDSRPLTNIGVSITLTDENGVTETGGHLIGGRADCKGVFDEAAYKAAAVFALDEAKALLVAEDAPAGVMDVVLKNGVPAVILHEAVGHGLEGDFNRRGIAAYSGKIGQKVAASEVTVIEDGAMPGERGSLHFDDEGTPTQRNVLIENGILKCYMQDRQNAQLMNVKPTGNGRRESYSHTPMPRMTNTYLAAGKHDPEDIIKSVKDGLYIVSMDGGQVDITSGKFNMRVRLAYRIRNGQICEPVKGATLVGDGPAVLQSITMVGNDLTLEKAGGMCGKNGQSIPVSLGQPTIRVAGMTVGGKK